MAQSPQPQESSPRLNKPSPRQVASINAATNDFGWMGRAAYQDEIKHLLSILQEDELLEKLLNVEHNGTDAWVLAITNRRFMLLTPKLFGGISTKEYPCDSITSVDWNPGRFRHRITVHVGHKKEEFYGLWRDGQFKARQTAELLQSKIPGMGSSVATDDRTRKAHMVEDFAREGQAMPIQGPELKHLRDVLGSDEVPERLASAHYLEWNGLNISKSIARDGLLVATNQRLLFLDKEPFSKLKVDEFAYDSIRDVTFTKGLFFSSVTINTDRGDEKFDKLSSFEVDGWHQHLTKKIDAI